MHGNKVLLKLSFAAESTALKDPAQGPRQPAARFRKHVLVGTPSPPTSPAPGKMFRAQTVGSGRQEAVRRRGWERGRGVCGRHRREEGDAADGPGTTPAVPAAPPHQLELSPERSEPATLRGPHSQRGSRSPRGTRTTGRRRSPESRILDFVDTFGRLTNPSERQFPHL